MKKSKGFTLVELLVTIAIVAAIFTIAILSLSGISKKKKELAYEKVKNETENAAEDYFNVNKCLLNNLQNGGSALISVKTLVEGDYLNRVIDPRNKAPLASCVKVTKDNNGGYSYKYQETLNDDDKKMCDKDSVIIVNQKGSPKVTAQIDSGTIGNNNWYTSAVKTSATASENGNGKITSFTYKTSYDDEGTSSNNKSLSQTNNSNDGNITITYTATNKDATATAYIYYKKDTVKPVCGYTLNKTVSPTGWFNIATGKPTITFNGSDAVSGLYSNASYKITNIKEGDHQYSQTFEDNAGNKQTCSADIKYDSIKPDCKISINGTKGETLKISGDFGKRYLKPTGTLTGWYTSNTTLSISDTSGLSNYGLSNKKYEFNMITSGTQETTTEKGVTWYLYKADAAGNECQSSQNIKVDTVKPEITKSGGGKVNCTGKNGEKFWGYSVAYKDNNLDSTLYLLEYYSDNHCTNYYWAIGGSKSTNSSVFPAVYTAFAGCSDNSTPKARFQVADAAGNVSDQVLITATKNNTSMQTGKCSSNTWYSK